MNTGWICPVCGRGNAPWKSECDCHKDHAEKQVVVGRTDVPLPQPLKWDDARDWLQPPWRMETTNITAEPLRGTVWYDTTDYKWLRGKVTAQS